MSFGHRLFAEQVGLLTDADVRGPSGLPGWSRAHVIGHVARNADALLNLVEWATSGIERHMYDSPHQRSADIERTQQKPVAALRTDLEQSAARLSSALTHIDPDLWSFQVRTARGRAIPLAEVPWMRAREVCIHAVDLNGTASFADLPEGFCIALVGEISAEMSTRPGCPHVRLATSDSASWTMGAGSGPPTEVRGPVEHLVAWLTRGVTGEMLSHSGPSVSAVPTWL